MVLRALQLLMAACAMFVWLMELTPRPALPQELLAMLALRRGLRPLALLGRRPSLSRRVPLMAGHQFPGTLLLPAGRQSMLAFRTLLVVCFCSVGRRALGT